MKFHSKHSYCFVKRHFTRKMVYLALGCVCGSLSGRMVGDVWPIQTHRHVSKPKAYEQTNVLGPIAERRWSENETALALRPFGSRIKRADGTEETHIAYPFFSEYRTPTGVKWNIFNLIQGSKNVSASGQESSVSRVYPFFLSKKSSNPEQTYSGVFPIGGHIKNFLGADSITWSFFPLYLATEHKGVTRHSAPWPFIRWQTGENAGGGALWPIAGHFWKQGQYDHRYMLWPLIYKTRDKLASGECRQREAFLPFFAYERSPEKNVSQFLWPFFAHIEENDPKFVEDQFLWPFFVQGRGDEDYINRWAPFYTHSIRSGVDKKWYMWPLIKVRKWEEKGVAIEQQQVLFFLIWSQRQQSLSNPNAPVAHKTHFWPLYSHWDDGAGRKQFQMLSPFEVFFPNNKIIRYNYSPLFALYRYDEPEPGWRSQSFLFGLVREDVTPESGRFSVAGPLFEASSDRCHASWKILKGLLGYENIEGKKSYRFLWLKL